MDCTFFRGFDSLEEDVQNVKSMVIIKVDEQQRYEYGKYKETKHLRINKVFSDPGCNAPEYRHREGAAMM